MYKSCKILIVLFVSLIFIQSCSQGPLSGDHAANMEKLDKIYGKCKNPHRQIVGKDARMICEDKERAAGPGGKAKDPISLQASLKILIMGVLELIIKEWQ